MKKKISESIQIKTFLSMLALLIVSCVLIYGLVMFFLPRNYHTLGFWLIWNGSILMQQSRFISVAYH